LFNEPEVAAVPDLSIGYIGWSPGPQDPTGPPANYGTHRVNCRYKISSTSPKFYAL